RAAIGAGPRRLAQQLLTESTIVSLLGAGLGVGVAFVLLDMMVSLAPGSIPRQEGIRIDGGWCYWWVEGSCSGVS
ncbi:MAG: hypothetical protein P8X82_17500, partial [Gemmatimonadales bacterium]